MANAQERSPESGYLFIAGPPESDRAKENIKKVARDPNCIVVYDNFNFMSHTRELAGGKQDEMINLTTAYIVSCLELGGAVQKANFRPRTKVTKRMVIDYILPRRKTIDNASKWLAKHLGAIFENEGTIDGVYKLYEELFKRRLGLD
ncbi:hypothetical protein B0T24DRAFT_599912 [Lasiosphaeria ovina]|uniref:Uncharacterized protein n=1 Tax=Lasiosphaeria ovina TaxID=92902 RepID=A0AAE0JSU7_9PEZI|nr:hypothetical protein B0T24DRAFT_599912 [Lasiosphaeria ovina]